MIDRTKVIKAIENCIGQPKCRDCPWEDCEVEHEVINLVPYELMRDALELLKEQEAVKPEKKYSGSGITWWNVCGNCKTAINPNDKYCHECGRAVKWDAID